MNTTKFFAIILAAAAALTTGCASSPSKFSANVADTPATSFCKAEAVKIAQKVGIRQMAGNPLSGHSDMNDVREAVLADCMSQVASR
jgi:hypothetical protein